MLVLQDLLKSSEDNPEFQELVQRKQEDLLVSELVKLQSENGAWKARDLQVFGSGDEIQATSQALNRLGYLGFGQNHPSVQAGAEYLFSLQRGDGSWELSRYRPETEGGPGYSMIPLQTAIPLRGLASCSYATDPRAEHAYDWLLEQRLPDGAWPTGVASGNPGYVAGYRRLAHSRWGCRSNTTGALICLALHPRRRNGSEARQALDMLLGRETKEKHTLGFEVARTVGAEPSRGFLTYYARFDLAQLLDLCWRVGASIEDERVAETIDFVRALRGPYGLWEYISQPQASRWVTFDILRSLSRLDKAGDWLSLEPRTPFQSYARRNRRF